jgi:hypothetical protein
MIDVTCPQCCTVYHSEESHLGKHVRCTRCGSYVPILRADRAVVKQSPVSPDSPSRRANAPSAKRQTHRIQRRLLFVVASAVVALTAISLVLLRHPTVAEKGTASMSGKVEPPSGFTAIGPGTVEPPSGFTDEVKPVQTPQNTENIPQFEVVDEEPRATPSPQRATDEHKFLPPADPRPAH